MAKRTETKKSSEPRWKRGQVASKRTSASTRSRKPSTRSRKKPGRRSRKKTVGNGTIFGIIRFAVIAVILWAGWVYLVGPVAAKISGHPVFTVRAVTVEGASYLSNDDIIAAAGVEPGVNIFDVNLAEVSRVLNERYAVEDFVVYRKLPDTVAIEVQERTPVALLSLDTLVGVDKNGEPLPHIGAELIDTLPIITGVKNVSALSDSTVKERIKAGIALLDRIHRDAPAVYGRVSEVDVSSISGLGINLVDNGLQVIIGDRDWSRKIPNLERIINEVTWRKDDVKVLDIQSGKTIVLRK